jgi:hypothetical protein
MRPDSSLATYGVGGLNQLRGLPLRQAASFAQRDRSGRRRVAVSLGLSTRQGSNIMSVLS